MRHLTYFIACTADGFIAREDGSFDFFPMTGGHLAFIAREYPETFPGHLKPMFEANGPNRHFDTVLMGRRTYEVGLQAGISNPYPHLRQFVFSRSMAASPDPAVELVNSRPIELVQRLKAESGMGIWLCGGAELAGALFAEIDELVLKVNPVVLGKGTPLFRGTIGPKSLELLEHQSFDGGVAIHRYRVVR